jgi:hypothetical protein
MLTAPSLHKFLDKNNMAVVPHPPYSPNLVPCDSFLFPKLNMALNRRRFYITMIQASQGDYFERDNIGQKVSIAMAI